VKQALQVQEESEALMEAMALLARGDLMGPQDQWDHKASQVHRGRLDLRDHAVQQESPARLAARELPAAPASEDLTDHQDLLAP